MKKEKRKYLVVTKPHTLLIRPKSGKLTILSKRKFTREGVCKRKEGVSPNLPKLKKNKLIYRGNKASLYRILGPYLGPGNSVSTVGEQCIYCR